MPVSQTDIVDTVSINPTDGVVELCMFEDRSWETTQIGQMLTELQSKVNRYIEYIFGGQMDASVEYFGRPRRLIIHTQYEPPEAAVVVYTQLLNHLQSIDIDFQAFVGADRSLPIQL